MNFAYEAIAASGRVVRDQTEADDRQSLLEQLRSRGLLPVKVEPTAAGSAPQPAATARGVFARFGQPGFRELVLFTRQLKMLLESGAALVPALEAVEQQSSSESFRRVVRSLRKQVETGSSFSDALAPHSRLFSPVYISMIRAGEATAALPDTFARLSTLVTRQQQARRNVIGAMIYPSVLAVLLTAVIITMMFFVIPRFNDLFQSLNVELPLLTRVLLDVSLYLRTNWAWSLSVTAVVVAAIVVLLRLPVVRAKVDEVLLRVPLLGYAIRRLVFGRIVRVWAALLRCHVPLLEALQQSRSVAPSGAFRRLLESVEDAVASGSRLGRALARTPLVDPVLASAIATGEENGRLPEAVDFVSDWLDSDNQQLVASVTRAAEPLMLSVMGLIVGLVAMALFIPLFDVATAAGG